MRGWVVYTPFLEGTNIKHWRIGFNVNYGYAAMVMAGFG